MLDGITDGKDETVGKQRADAENKLTVGETAESSFATTKRKIANNVPLRIPLLSVQVRSGKE